MRASASASIPGPPHLYLVPSLMTSTLCVKNRLDLCVAPGIVDPPTETQEAVPGIQIANLVKLMRATCLDVAEVATSSVMQLADSTICVARAIKLRGGTNYTEAEELEVEGLPADLAYMTWGKDVQYKDNPFGESIINWLKNSTLPALAHMRPIECSDAALCAVYDDLIHRCATKLPNDLGALLKYRMVEFDSYHSYWKRHTYLFETAVVVMGEGDSGFIPPGLVSKDTKIDPPLQLIRLDYLRDVTEVVPTCTSISGNYVYDLTFKHRAQRNNFVVGFNDVPTAVDWIIGIRRIQFQGRSEDLYSPEKEDIKGFVSFAVLAQAQAHQWQLAISQPLKHALYHTAVIVHGSNEAKGYCHLVIFSHTVVFVQGSPPKVQRYLLASRITSMAETTTDNGTGITLVYRTEVNGCIHFEEFRFGPADTDADVRNSLLCALRTFAPNASAQSDVHQKLRMLAHRLNQHGPVRWSKDTSMWVAGLAMLHATSMPNELNISVAVLPTFESDGIATRLLAYILEVAFEKFNAHRVQARVVHSSKNPAQTARAIRMLIHLGFTHEGVRRRSVLHPTEGQRVDVSMLAMLELDWIRRASVTPLKGTLWDEMFARQQHEREMLLSMESSRELKKTRSTETVRDLHSMNDAVPSASMVSPSVGCLTVTSDTASQVSMPISSWGGNSDGSDRRFGEVKGLSIASMSSADDAADEYEEWDLEEDYSDDGDGEEEAELKE